MAVEHHARVGMSQPVGHQLDMHACLHQERGVTVPRVVQANMRQARAAHQQTKALTHVAERERSSGRVGKHQPLARLATKSLPVALSPRGSQRRQHERHDALACAYLGLVEQGLGGRVERERLADVLNATGRLSDERNINCNLTDLRLVSCQPSY
jgi:hypothetical protein